MMIGLGITLLVLGNLLILLKLNFLEGLLREKQQDKKDEPLANP